MQEVSTIGNTITGIIEDVPLGYGQVYENVIEALEARERTIRANLFGYALDCGFSGYTANQALTDCGLTTTVATVATDGNLGPMAAALLDLESKFIAAIDNLRSQFNS